MLMQGFSKRSYAANLCVISAKYTHMREVNVTIRT